MPASDDLVNGAEVAVLQPTTGLLESWVVALDVTDSADEPRVLEGCRDALGRLDVWPTGDFGVRKGYAVMHDIAVMPTAVELGPLGDPYRPYRSVAAWYCWRAVE